MPPTPGSAAFLVFTSVGVRWRDVGADENMHAAVSDRLYGPSEIAAHRESPE